MARFDRQIATALRLIAKNGRKVTWRQFQRTEDPNEPGRVIASPPIDREATICFLPVDRDNKRFLQYIAGSNELKIGSEVGLMGQVEFTPDGADVVLRDSETLQIANFDKLAPNGQNILYTIEFK